MAARHEFYERGGDSQLHFPSTLHSTRCKICEVKQISGGVKNMKLTVMIICIAGMIFSSSVFSATIRVPADQPTIQAGIDAAVDGDTVLVADGTYTGAGNRDIDFKGKAITVASENGAENCVIDCPWHQGFILTKNESNNSVIRGLTIQNGNESRGGGIYCEYSSPTILDCRLINNHAYYTGGGIYARFSSLIIINCKITNNIANDKGGGIFSWNSSPTIINCDITENVSLEQNGGGIACYKGSITISNCDLSRNSSDFSGASIGLLDIFFGSIINCTIMECFQIEPGSAGSLACATVEISYSSNLYFYNVNISQNSSAGIYIENSENININNCLIASNTSTKDGGRCVGIQGSTGTLMNCTISENIMNNDGCIHCSLSDSMIISNCIIWNNLPQEVSRYGSPQIVYSDIKGGFTGIGNINAKPLFVDSSQSDFHLQNSSPCIDSGTDIGTLPYDFNRKSRPQGGAIDMGAYEYQEWPAITRAYVEMPSRTIQPGDRVKSEVTVWNPNENTLDDYPLFMILNVFGNFFCAPSFTNFDYIKWSFPSGLTELTVIPEFIWPSGVGSASGIVWYAFLMNPEMTELASEVGVFDFGWSE